jgi:hypothetical protein
MRHAAGIASCRVSEIIGMRCGSNFDSLNLWRVPGCGPRKMRRRCAQAAYWRMSGTVLDPLLGGKTAGSAKLVQRRQ